MKFLLTGFEPFGGSQVNPSGQVVEALSKSAFNDLIIIPLILPVVGDEASARVIHAIGEFQPEVVLSLGEAPRRSWISIERVAINLIDYRIPDNQGNLIIDQPVVKDGPAAYFCTLPIKKILQAIKADGVPAELSLTAGTFLCNQVLFTVLDYCARQQPKVKAGFIHLPSLPEQVIKMPGQQPSMGLETSIKAILAAIGAIYTDRD